MCSDPPNQLVMLIRVPSEIEAASIVAAIEAEGIAVTMTGGYTAGFIAEAPGDVQVKVLGKDRVRAEEAIRQHKQENATIDWTQIDVGEPE